MNPAGIMSKQPPRIIGKLNPMRLCMILDWEYSIKSNIPFLFCADMAKLLHIRVCRLLF